MSSPRSYARLAMPLLSVVWVPAAYTATAQMCGYNTLTTVQNVSGYDLQFTGTSGTGSNHFNIYPNPAMSSTTPLVVPTGGTTGFMQTWGQADSDTGGNVYVTIQDGITNPQFTLWYWSGVGSNPGTVADAATVGATQVIEDVGVGVVNKSIASSSYAEFALVIPPPGDAIAATADALKIIWDIAADIISNLNAEAYLNVYSNGTTYSNPQLVLNTDQTNTIIVGGSGSTTEEQMLNGYVVSATAINASSGNAGNCPNSWNVVVAPYCAYVCAYGANTTPVSVPDANCLVAPYSSYCSVLQTTPGASISSVAAPQRHSLLPGASR